MINFISKDVKELPDGLFRHYTAYVEEYQNKLEALKNCRIDENIYKNNLEKIIAGEIRNLGHEVKAGVEIAGLSADLLVDGKFVIEVDGVEDSIKPAVSNMKKQSIIERCGFDVKRVTYREWQYSQNACLDRLLMN